MSDDELRTALLTAYRTSHDAVRETMLEVPDDWLTWTPAPDVNSPGFLLWHLLRDEDVIVQGELAALDQVWTHGGWASRVQAPATSQGTGFDKEQVAQVKVSKADLIAYAESVWSATEQVLSTLSPSRFQDDAFGRPMLEHLLGGSVGHNWVHLGEIRMLMGLRGWRFRE